MKKVCHKSSLVIFKTLQRSRLTSVGGSHNLNDVKSHFSESADVWLIKGVVIDSSIQVSHSGVSIESVITQQILGEQFRRCWRGGWRRLMSWGTGNGLWVEGVESGDGELESFLQPFLLHSFFFMILSLRAAAPSLRHRGGNTQWKNTVKLIKFPSTCFYVLSVIVKKIETPKNDRKPLYTWLWWKSWHIDEKKMCRRVTETDVWKKVMVVK